MPSDDTVMPVDALMITDIFWSCHKYSGLVLHFVPVEGTC
jgi:hypothetical protein